MSVPNYAPSGTVLFGCVPWSDSYDNVRLYPSLDEQYADISRLMTDSSDSYTYIGRNRRLKVAVPADRLYHCNYCMYRNESLTDGWIYCFVTDVTYISDNVSELTLETDVFQTYLYGVDWEIPPCYIERETVRSDSGAALYTSEPSFPLTYIVDYEKHYWFGFGGVVMMTTSDLKQANDMITDFLNPSGYYTESVDTISYKGVYCGGQLTYYPPESLSSLSLYLRHLNEAAGMDSVISMFSVPELARDIILADPMNLRRNSSPDYPYTYQAKFDAPERGSTIDGYTPRNRKLFYYPYNYCRLTDYQGSYSDLRFELMGENREIGIKYALNPTNKAIAVPIDYAGCDYYDLAIITEAGSPCSWQNESFAAWLAQASNSIGANVLTSTLQGGMAGAAMGALGSGAGAGVGALAGAVLGGIGSALGTMGQKVVEGSQEILKPATVKGEVNSNLSMQTGLQGVHAQRVQVKNEVAQLIDAYFDRWGYSVQKVKNVEPFVRPSWYYVLARMSAPKSTNGRASESAPFSRGRGTPASALAVIKSHFDNGMTFWHTTANFGDYGMNNGV